ncbi:MAG TPA: DUF4870 domain-containing protein [Opitutae bacterium]|nr:DUF4870 domain-containing protein [Opitutae bacterium]
MNNEHAEPTPPATEAPQQQPPELTTTAKTNTTWGMLCHLLSLCQLLGIPLGNVIGPLVLWLVKRKEDPFVEVCGKESVNFQLSMTLYMVISFLLMFVFIGFFTLIAVMVLNIVYTIIAAIKASEGISYRYPATIRFIK